MQHDLQYGVEVDPNLPHSYVLRPCLYLHGKYYIRLATPAETLMLRALTVITTGEVLVMINDQAVGTYMFPDWLSLVASCSGQSTTDAATLLRTTLRESGGTFVVNHGVEKFLVRKYCESREPPPPSFASLWPPLA